MSEPPPVDRAAIAADLEAGPPRTARTPRQSHRGEPAPPLGRHPLDNEQLLFHMVFGYPVVRRLLVLVRVFSRLPNPIGRGFARALDAGTPLFHQINYLGSCAAATVFDHRRMGPDFDRVIAKLQHCLAQESGPDLQRKVAFPVRWDQFFDEVMTLEQVYRDPGKHFDFHRDQLTLG